MDNHSLSEVCLFLEEVLPALSDFLLGFLNTPLKGSVPVADVEIDPFVFDNDGESGEGDQSRLEEGDHIGLIKRSQRLLHLPNKVAVVDSSGPFAGPKDAEFDVEVKANVDHDGHFRLEQSLHECLFLFLVVLDCLQSLPFPQNGAKCLDDVLAGEVDVLCEFGGDKNRSTSVHEPVEAVEGDYFGLAVEKKQGSVHHLQLGPLH